MQRFERAALTGRNQDLHIEQATLAEKFTDRADDDQDQRVTEPVTDTVERAGDETIVHRETLGAPEHDTVGDD